MKNGTSTPGSLLILTGTCPDGRHTMLECTNCHHGGLERCRYPLYGIMPVIYEADPPEPLIYDKGAENDTDSGKDRQIS